jgi:hypothetical protein
MNVKHKRVVLGDIANITSGGTPSRSNSAYWNGNIPWVKTTQIQNCIINKTDVDEWITVEGLKKSSAKMVSAGTNERDIEKKLVEHITKFLLELGKGFAFVGRQYHLEVGETDYYLDLLFYHIKLKCYVVIELKNTKFIPEYAGKLNFYLSAVDSLLKTESDNSTIGMLLCRDKNKIETEFALRDINKPMGVSEFTLTEVLPDELKGSLPTVEEIEEDMKQLNDEG